MTYYLEDQPGIDSWDQLDRVMTPSTVVYDQMRRVVLLRGHFYVLVQEPPAGWRARHRRSLHRLGFRRMQGSLSVWEWTPREDDVRSAVIPLPASIPGNEWLEAFLARGPLLDARCVVVLRDVFGLTPADLHLTVLVDDEDEDWDQVG